MREDASELLKQKITLEEEKKALENSATQKQIALERVLKTIGNYVHDSVPVSNTEVGHQSPEHGGNGTDKP